MYKDIINVVKKVGVITLALLVVALAGAGAPAAHALVSYPPAALLQVGDITSSLILDATIQPIDLSLSSALSWIFGGKVGVATSTPAAALGVQGNAIISGDITSVANVTATGTATVNNLTVTGTCTGCTGGTNKVFGSGSDGALTVASNSTTTLTRDMQYTNLTVNGTLLTMGYKITVSGTLSGSGTILWGYPNQGTDNLGGGGTAVAGGAATTTGELRNSAGGISAGNASQPGSVLIAEAMGSPGGNGGNGGTSATTTPYQPFGYFAFNTINLAEASSTMATTTNSSTQFTWLYSIYGYGPAAGGGGGGSQGEGFAGGGGGASGGTIWIAAKTFAGTFTIWAEGARGGNVDCGCGANSSGGGGGGGGTVVVIYGTKTYTGTIDNVGGTGGTKKLGGQNGANGKQGMTYLIQVDTLI